MNTETPWVATFVKDYVAQVCECLYHSVAPCVDALAQPFIEVTAADRATVYAFGNGGSSAIAQTLGWTIREVAGPFLRGTRCMCGWSVHHLMEAAALGGFEESAVRLLEGHHAASPDLVVLVSGSGNSRNLVAAARHCLARRIPVLSFTGRTGGEIGRLGVAGLRVDSADQQVIEDCVHAAVHVVLRRMADLLSGRGAAPGAAAHLRTLTRATFHQDVAWIDRVSSALARSAARRRRVNVVAPEGGALGLSVEHIAHNLSWDLRHQIPGARLSVRSAASPADYTGMVNDSGVLGIAAARLVEDTTANDVTVVFAHDADHPAVAEVRDQAAAAGLTVYGWYGAVAGHGANEHISLVGGDRLLRVFTAQVTGHLLLRIARAKIPRYLDGGAAVADEESRARSPVAPLGNGGGTDPDGDR